MKKIKQNTAKYSNPLEGMFTSVTSLNEITRITQMTFCIMSVFCKHVAAGVCKRVHKLK